MTGEWGARPRAGGYPGDRAGGYLRVSDEERDRAVTALGEHYAAGRLTKDEYDERADAAMSAKTRDDLSDLFTDLRGPTPPPRPGWSDSGSGQPGQWRRSGHRLRSVLLAVAVVLLVLTVITHLPWILLGVLLWCVVGRRMFGRGWHGRRHAYR